jgi:hypothetical protein
MLGIGVNISKNVCSGSRYILDTKVKNASIAYSLRKLSKNASKCIRVRRSSDNSELDIGFVSNIIDTYSMISFASGGSCYVATLYDQSGNNIHAYQSNTDKQPRIINSGTFDNGILFDNTDDVMDSGAVYNQKQVNSCHAQIKASSYNLGRIFDKYNKLFYVTALNKLGFGQDYSSGDGLWNSDDAISIGSYQKISYTYDGVVTNNPKFYISGVLSTTTRTSTPVGTLKDDSAQNLYIGNNGTNTRRLNGHLYEMILFDRELTQTEITFLCA